MGWTTVRVEPARGSRSARRSTPGGWCYARVLDGEAIVVAINNAAAPATVECAAAAAGLADGTAFRDRLAPAGELRVTSGALRVELEPRSAAVQAR